MLLSAGFVLTQVKKNTYMLYLPFCFSHSLNKSVLLVLCFNFVSVLEGRCRMCLFLGRLTTNIETMQQKTIYHLWPNQKNLIACLLQYIQLAYMLNVLPACSGEALFYPGQHVFCYFLSFAVNCSKLSYG